MPPADQDSIDATLAAAATAWGRAVELVDDLSFSDRATVLRIQGDGERAVAKRSTDPAAHRIELAALQALPVRTCPEILGHDDEVIVMSDLGDGPSLADLLLGDDPRAAVAALSEWARTLGRIAAVTGRVHATEATAVPFPDRETFDEFCTNVTGHVVPEGVWQELASARSTLLAGACHHAFMPNDACPDNNRCIGDAVVLFDFEFSGRMHVASVAAYCLVPFCSCWCVARLPEGMPDQLFAAFCDEYRPEARAEFRADVVRAGALQMLDLVPAFARWLDPANRPRPVGRAPSTNQQRTIQRLDWIAAEHAVLPHTARLAAEIAAAYSARHPSPELPLYPAFR
jgi:hypothetical protein